MALGQYSDLQTAIENWLAKSTDTDVTANIADFIALGEQDIRTVLDTGYQETYTSSVAISTEFTTLSSISSQLTFIRRIRLTGTTPQTVLSYRTPDQMLVDYPSTDLGQPSAYCIEANRIQVRPVPDTSYAATITYRAWFDPLATTSTNALLTSWPGIYLYSGLHHAANFLEDWDAAAAYKAKFMESASAFQSAADRLLYSGGPLTVRSDTGNP